MDDLNWLLSTIAQATAALVAIVGGFIITRVVTEQTERAGAFRVREVELDRQHRLEREVRELKTELIDAGYPEDMFHEARPRLLSAEEELEDVQAAVRRASGRMADPAAHRIVKRTLLALGVVTIAGLVAPIAGLALLDDRSAADSAEGIAFSGVFVASLIVLAIVLWSVAQEISGGFTGRDLPA